MNETSLFMFSFISRLGIKYCVTVVEVFELLFDGRFMSDFFGHHVFAALRTSSTSGNSMQM